MSIGVLGKSRLAETFVVSQKIAAAVGTAAIVSRTFINIDAVDTVYGQCKAWITYALWPGPGFGAAGLAPETKGKAGVIRHSGVGASLIPCDAL